MPLTPEDLFADEVDTGPQTAYQIARDVAFLALVCEALVAVAHQRLRDSVRAGQPIVWETVTDEVVFASRAARSPESFQHSAALAVLSRLDAPATPYDGVWLRHALTEIWPTLAVACLRGSTL